MSAAISHGAAVMTASTRGKPAHMPVVHPPPPSRRLQQAAATASSLEAQYAVLSEASAKSAELETLLRNNQPLLWLDNALVMQKGRQSTQQKKPHEAAGNRRNRQKLLSVREKQEELTPTTSDSMELLLLPLESDLRHRRRVRWEVAKRIARVEREINKQPQSSQRFWHVKEKEKRLEEEATQRKHEQLLLQEKEEKHENEERARRRQRAQQIKSAEATTQQLPRAAATAAVRRVTFDDKVPMTKQPTGTSNIDLDLDLNFLETPLPSKPRTTTAAKPVYTTTTTTSGDSSEAEQSDQENTPPPQVVAPPPVGIQIENSPVPLRRGYQNDKTDDGGDPPTDDLLAKVARASLEEEDAVGFGIKHHELHEDDDHQSPRMINSTTANQVAMTKVESSLGRQVLSEYRTFPSSVAFGAQAITSTTTGGHERRLNSDVLRRLFSDLDSDRDGHLNRIETCMALHRLQIHVAAPRIVAFFKRIHGDRTVDDARARPRTRTARVHAPLKEVINYKQFVAFVTAAFEQQQSQLQQQHVRHRRKRSELALPLPLPLPPLSIHTTTPPAHPSPEPTTAVVMQHVGRQDTMARTTTAQGDSHHYQKEVRLVEQTTNQDELLADRMLRQLPDFLTSHFLQQASSPPADDHGSRLRRSLEKLARGSDRPSSPSLLDNVVQDLVRKYVAHALRAKKSDVHDDDDDDDVSGLGRAGAFFDGAMGGVLPVDDHTSDDPQEEQERHVRSSGEWWNILTQEQVAALVSEISQQLVGQQNNVAIPAALESDEGNDDGGEGEGAGGVVTTATGGGIALPLLSQPEEAEQIETGRNESVATGHVQCVADKGIQTQSIEWDSAPPPPPPVTPPPEAAHDTPVSVIIPPPSPLPTRSALARAILAMEPRLFQLQTTRAAATVDVLADLRQKRRRRQATQMNTSKSVDSQSSGGSIELLAPPPPPPPPRTTVPQRLVPHEYHLIDPRNPETLDENAAYRGNAMDEEPVVPSPLPLKEKSLLPTRTSFTEPQWLARSSSSSRALSSISDSISSSATSGRINLFRQLEDDLPPHQRRQRSLGRPLPSERTRAFGHSDPIDGDGEGDLSEGEMAHTTLADELSDGELFGSTKRNVVRIKNAQTATALLQRKDDGDDQEGGGHHSDALSGSLESGEMLPSMIHHRHKLLLASMSSLESGEAEDGAMLH